VTAPAPPGVGAVVWITGLPASGKSTLAARLRSRLVASGRTAVIIDSDEVRAAIAPTLGYDQDDRDAFYGKLARVANVIARQDVVALVAATAPRRQHREQARAIAPRFVEVWIRTPLEVCEARDPKGLYAKARAGGAPSLPGVGVDYEPPASPEVTADGGADDAAVDAVVRILDREGSAAMG
jgi:adenylylsulfate kinase